MSCQQKIIKDKTEILNISQLIFPFCFSIVLLLSYFIGYKLAFQTSSSDLYSHIGYAEKMFAGNYKTATPVFYYMWGLFNKLLGVQRELSGAYAYTVFSGINFIAIYFIIKLFLKDKITECQRCIIVMFMTFFGPLYVPSFSESYYLGQSSFNVWHNPTNTAVKFAFVLAFFLFIYSFDMDEKERIDVWKISMGKKTFYNLIIGLITFVSTFIKPSFFQVFAPTIAIVYIIDLIVKRKNIIYYIKNGLVFLPSVAVIFYQTFILFLSENNIRGGLVVDFLEVWGYYSPNVLISILITITFPIFVIILFRRTILNDFKYVIAIVFYIVSALEAAVLAETAGTYSGNLMWGMSLGIGAIFLYSIFKFVDYCIENNSDNKKAVRFSIFIGYVLLSLHFLWGVWYYYKILTTVGVQCF